MADNLQRIRNQLIQGLSTILWQLNVENLENNRLDSLQFRVDWIYGIVVRYQGLYVIGSALDSIHQNHLGREGLRWNI